MKRLCITALSLALLPPVQAQTNRAVPAANRQAAVITRANHATQHRGPQAVAGRYTRRQACARSAHGGGMLVRISEIEIHSEYLDKYKAILKEEAEASVRLEPGVVSIFPMYQKADPKQVRILEIYASRAAYESHLKTPHFQKYKTTTLKMVKSLKLVDMEAMGPETMAQMFRKMKTR